MRKTTKKLELSWSQLDDDEKIRRCGQGLPDKDAPIEVFASEILVLLKLGDAALREGRDDDAIFRRIECCVLRANGDEHFNSAQARKDLVPLVKAADGKRPFFGQPGRFVMPLIGGRCRAVIAFDDLLDLSFDAEPVDFDRPFVSETGYSSYHSNMGLTATWSSQLIPLKQTLAQYVDEIVTKQATRDAISGKPAVRKDGTPLPPRLYDLKPQQRWRHREGTSISEKYEWKPAPPEDDAAWKKGGWLRKLADNPPPRFVEPGANLSLL